MDFVRSDWDGWLDEHGGDDRLTFTASEIKAFLAEIDRLRAELDRLRGGAAEDCAVQYAALVECDESELSPDAIRVRRILTRDRDDAWREVQSLAHERSWLCEMVAALAAKLSAPLDGVKADTGGRE